MTPEAVLNAAKQGNPKAIAALINRHLKPQRITAKTKLTDGCLQVLVEGATVPNQTAIVPFIVKGVRGLKVEVIKSLMVSGRRLGEDMPDWTEQVALNYIAAVEPVESKASDQSAVKSKKQYTRPEKFQMICGIFVLFSFMLWFLNSCTYPHNCEEAKANLANADSDLDGFLRKAANGTATQENIQGAIYAKGLAEKKCPICVASKFNLFHLTLFAYCLFIAAKAF